MFDTADDIGFWIVAVIVAVLFFVLTIVAAKWVMDRTYRPLCSAPSRAGDFRDDHGVVPVGAVTQLCTDRPRWRPLNVRRARRCSEVYPQVVPDEPSLGWSALDDGHLAKRLR